MHKSQFWKMDPHDWFCGPWYFHLLSERSAFTTQSRSSLRSSLLQCDFIISMYNINNIFFCVACQRTMSLCSTHCSFRKQAMEIYYWSQNRLYWRDAHEYPTRFIVQPIVFFVNGYRQLLGYYHFLFCLRKTLVPVWNCEWFLGELSL